MQEEEGGDDEEEEKEAPQSMQLAISFMFVKCLFIALRLLRLLLRCSPPPSLFVAGTMRCHCVS